MSKRSQRKWVKFNRFIANLRASYVKAKNDARDIGLPASFTTADANGGEWDLIVRKAWRSFK